ncbi:MAG TPA: prepilin-type N-terminal cleavage/methylation domain-containing protein [Lacipirellulaceae bacterium]|nr:prepilin-type N-terminal cleavage/methylation domain-containing protein [Lacipirellulaceae bacterium]
MHKRTGFTLVELVVAASLMGALLATSVQMLRVLSNHQRSATRRAIALEAVQAVAERVSNSAWDQLTPENMKQATLPAPIEHRLPGAKVAVGVTDESAPMTSKRVTVEVTWPDMYGEPGPPARLTTWVFPDSSSE